MSWLEDFRCSERRYRNYVRYDLHLRAPEALRTIELNVPAKIVERAFRFAWDHHRDDWDGAVTIRDFDQVAEESSLTIMHYIADATAQRLEPATG